MIRSKMRALLLATTATAAIASAPAAAVAAPAVGTSVTPLAGGGWSVSAWYFQWKASASVQWVAGKGWVVTSSASGANVGASAGAQAGTNPLQAAAQAAAYAFAKQVAASAKTP